MGTQNTPDDFLSELHREHFKSLVKLCRAYVGFSPELSHRAEDIVQDAFVVALKKEDVLRKSPKQYGWLAKVCWHLTRRELKKKGRQTTNIPFWLDDPKSKEIPDIETVIDDWLDLQYSKEVLEKVVSMLTENQQEVYEDYFANEMTAPDVAKKHGKSAYAIKSAVGKIRKKAKPFYDKDIFRILLFWVVSFWHFRRY